MYDLNEEFENSPPDDEVNPETEVVQENEESEGEPKEPEVENEAKPQENYLEMAQRLAADFENYRRHAQDNLQKARFDGEASVIEVFLPCLDTFKEAKKNISDENVLKGVNMIEDKINEALKTLGVEKIQSIGRVYDPHTDNVIAVMRDDEKENDIILEEYQAGYKYKDKVLRYAKVIVNKKED